MMVIRNILNLHHITVLLALLLLKLSIILLLILIFHLAHSVFMGKIISLNMLMLLAHF